MSADQLFDQPQRKPRSDPRVKEVYDYWVQAMGKNGRTKLTPERRRKVVARLREGYDVARIKRAIDGCAGSEFHRLGRYDDLELICRSGSKLEMFEARPIGAAGESDHEREMTEALARND